MKKRSKLKKGLAILLSLAMVVGLMPGVGTVKVSAAEPDENTVNMVSSNDVEVPEQTGEPTPEQTDGQETNKLITTWQWIDEEEYLDEETGSLSLPGASEEVPALFEDVTGLLPMQINAMVENTEDSENPENAVEETITLGEWVCEDYPEEGAYTGSYTFTATLPEGYELSEEAEALTVTVELGGAQTYEAAGADGYDNGFCTTYDASKNSCSNNTHENCSGYQPATDSDGDGVYEISNAGQLYWFAGLVNGTLTGVEKSSSAKAELTADIIVNANVLKGDGTLVDDTGSFTSWTPIGREYPNYYTGTFDGQNHTISGLYFNNTDSSAGKYGGLFGYVYGGKISNVGVVNSYINAYQYVGGVCGDIGGSGSITNCYFSGIVNGANWYVGGVCGLNYGTVSNCYFNGQVSGSSDVGGVCGRNCSTITNCYFDSTKCGMSAIGIDVSDKTQENVLGKSTIQFNSGEVAYLLQSGQTADGEGNIPEVWGQCLSGETLDDYPVFGGTKVYQHIIGEDEANPSYYYTNSEEATGHIHQMTKVEAKDATCEADGNYEYWTCSIEEGVYYKDENGTAKYSSKAATVIAGGHKYTNGICSTCSAGQPAELNAQGVYEISNAGQLYWFAGLVNGTLTDGTAKNTAANAVLTADIVVNSGLEGKNGLLDSLTYDSHGNVTNGASFRSWTPIGNDENLYIGTFDGNGYTVSGLYFNESNRQYVGLFGYVGRVVDKGVVLNGKVSNVGIVDSYYKASEHVGGVCGKSWYGTIANCYNTGKVSGDNHIGGVCGSLIASDVAITNCYNKGDVSGTDDIGGVCGYIDGIITSSYNTGKVSGVNFIGGVCGYFNNGTITNCYYDNINYTGNAVGYNYEDRGTISENVRGKTTDEFKSGEVAYLLNGRNSENTEDKPLIWYQNIDSGTADTYPVLDNTHGIVYIGNPCAVYTNESHKEHSYVINADGKSHTCSDCGKTEQHADVATFNVDNENHSIKATCPSCGDLGTIRLSASDATYDGTEKAASISDEIKGFSPDIVYEKKAEDGSFATIDSIPKDAGTYRASITYTVGEEPENKYSVSVEYTIAKADTTKTENCEMVLTFDEYANTYTATITEVDGAEYKFDNGGWSNKNMYTGIAHGTEVTGYIRIAAISDNYNPGTESSKTLTSGHGTMTHVEAKDADCVTDGNSEYWYCESCKKYFSDAQGTTKTTKEAVTIAATGHTDS
ncbi:MAG: GLUG motif-containing protein, partial [Segatella copri]